MIRDQLEAGEDRLARVMGASYTDSAKATMVLPVIAQALLALARIQLERLEAVAENSDQVKALAAQLNEFMQQSQANADKPLTVVHVGLDPDAPTN
jgi:hypothetical protein